MANVFISHSSHDAALARRISDDLRRAGMETWVDSDSIPVGTGIPDQIEMGILGSSHIVLLLSCKAIESEWVHQEWICAMWQRLSERRRKLVIPCLVEKCEIPMHLQHLRYADFTEGYVIGFAQIYAMLVPMNHQWPEDFLPADQLVALEQVARTHTDNFIRFACSHTIWSVRPDRAKPLLENQLGDWSSYVKKHAELLLGRYY